MKFRLLLPCLLLLCVLPAFAQDAEFYYKRGNDYGNKGELDKAIADFTQALTIDPNYAVAYSSRGLAYHYKGELDRAIADFTRAIALNPNLTEAYYYRGLAYATKGELDRAIEDSTKAIALYPNLTEAYYYRGFAYYTKGELDRAITDFTRAIALNPKLEQAYSNRGAAYKAKGELDKAIADYSQAIALNPKNDSAYNNRGNAYNDKGELDSAIADYTQAIVLNPKLEQAYNNRGIALVARGELDKAIADYTQAIVINPKYDSAYNNRGLAYVAKGEPDRAITDYTQVIALNPKYDSAYSNRGIAYVAKGELDKAIADYTQAIALNPKLGQAYNNRGLAYADKGEPDRAIADYTQAISLNPKLEQAYNNRGNAYRAKGELDRAIADYTQAIALNPKFDMAYNNRGNAYRAKGEPDRAIADYTQAIALNPKFDMAYNNRGNAYADKGEPDRAIADYTQAIALNPKLEQAYNNRGIAYTDKGEMDRAIADYTQAIALNPKLEQAYNNRGVAYRAKGELDRAIADYTQAIALNPKYDYAYNNRGAAYNAKGELDRAIADYTQAIALNPKYAEAYNNRGNEYAAKGEFDRAIADYTQAAITADGSANILDIFVRSWEFAGFLYKNYPFLGAALDENAFHRQYANVARDALALSIAKVEKARAGLGSRGAALMAGMVYQYYAALDFEARFGSAERAFAVSEGLRSRGFLEQMGTEAALRLPGIAPTDAKRVRELIEIIGKLQEMLGKLNPQTQQERYAEAGLALTRAEEELASLDKRITETVPRYASLRNPKTAALGETKAFCGNDTAILEFAIWDSSVEFTPPATSTSQSHYKDRPSINSYCLVITRDGLTPVALDNSFDYAGTVKALREKLFSVDGNMIIPNDETVFEIERNALYNALIKPVLDKIPGNIKNILIVPDSNLAFLPFDILRENNNPGTRSLGERFSITLSPSVSVSMIAAQTNVPLTEPVIAFGGAWYEPNPGNNSPSIYQVDVNNNRLAALSKRLELYRGNSGEAPKEQVRAVEYFSQLGGWLYLAGTVAEIQGLERITTVAPKIIQGKDVSKRRVKELSRAGTLLNYPIVHFACHGFFNDNLTPQAALVFSEVSGLLKNESDEDGYLSIEEIALLNLKARMVMLSACQTGLGSLKRGDGMAGLARAFMVAGAKNVGVSLWEIDDTATAEFMWNVYRKVIREGKTFRDAYREVKEEFRNGIIVSRNKRVDWSHPYYWAAFVLYE